MDRRAGLLLVTPILLLLAACDREHEPAPYRPPVDRIGLEELSGASLYLRDCAWCHGDTGGGTRYGPPIEGSGEAGVDFYLSTGRMPLLKPSQTADRGDPLYGEEEIEAIVEYTGTFSTGHAIPEVNPDEGEYDLGADLYLDNCAACHSSTGAGAILTSGIRVADLLEADPREIAEAMVVGPRGMPVFDHYDQKEIDSIVRYVVALQETPERGGHRLGGLGPFSEGAVAWIVGMGALLLVIRWIGTRADE